MLQVTSREFRDKQASGLTWQIKANKLLSDAEANAPTC